MFLCNALFWLATNNINMIRPIVLEFKNTKHDLQSQHHSYFL